MTDIAFFALKGQIWKAMDHGPMYGMLMSASAQKTCRILQNLNMLFGLVFRPLRQIC